MGGSPAKWLKQFFEESALLQMDPLLLLVVSHASHKNLGAVLFSPDQIVRICCVCHTDTFIEVDARRMQNYSYLKNAAKDVAGRLSTAFAKICRTKLAKSAFACRL
jgi:hypothetical protein